MTNVIYEQARLNERVQQEGESVEAFITSVYELAEHCGYQGIAKDEHIRDRIVTGIKDKEVSQALQLEAGLTLRRAVEMVRHSALVKRQMGLEKRAANMD